MTKAQGKPRGFAAMSKEKRVAIASLGGKASHGGGRKKGTLKPKYDDAE